MERRVLPLFPLNVVLFPGMILPLRVFEPRYRLMVERCLDADKQFGVVLIKEGQEVGEAAEPFLTGTLAEIQTNELLPDGNLMVVGLGLRRFAIERMVEGAPYLQAEVTILDEGDPAEAMPPGLIEEIVPTFQAYLQNLARISNIAIELPEDGLSHIDLSYLVASTLPLDNLRKQSLLEIPEALPRLRKELDLLRQENEAIEMILAEGRAKGDMFYRGKRISLN